MAKEAIEIQEGQTIDHTLTSDVNVGDVIPLGTMVGVAVTSGLTGEVIAVKLEGVWQITATTADAITVGAIVYFDATNRVVTITATANTLAGKAVSAKAGATAGSILVKINA